MDLNFKNLKLLAIVFLGLSHCRVDDGGSREISGHDFRLGFVMHAAGATGAERLCTSCHGTKLLGGDNGEASCYQCHANVWKVRDPDTSEAPADHTANLGGYYHRQEHSQPVGTCDNAACHANDLQGIGIASTPGCFTCHEQLWQ